jgi:BirA family biotin operon repressor/biotin-[acetyl-CoA-carboxylase] ligase
VEEFAFIDQVGKIMLFYTPSCGSTQDLVPLCAKQTGGKHPTALLTFHQTQGRGQQSRTWNAEPGKNLAMSIWLPLRNPRPESFPLLNMALTAACVKALAQLNISTEIKWPNDLRFRGSKLAGLLMETHSIEETGKSLCMGIGVNVNQTDFEELSQAATSLKNITGKEQNLMDLARILLTRIQAAFVTWEKQPDNAEFLQNFNEHLEGKNALWEAETNTQELIQGTLCGVDAHGRLLFNNNSDTIPFHHGSIRLKRMLPKS